MYSATITIDQLSRCYRRCAAVRVDTVCEDVSSIIGVSAGRLSPPQFLVGARTCGTATRPAMGSGAGRINVRARFGTARMAASTGRKSLSAWLPFPRAIAPSKSVVNQPSAPIPTWINRASQRVDIRIIAIRSPYELMRNLLAAASWLRNPKRFSSITQMGD